MGFIIIEGVFSISGEANLSRCLSRPNRIIFHWIFLTTGLTLMLIALIIIIIHKNRLGKTHFVTTHGQLGLGAFIIAGIVVFLGILANNTRWFYPHVRPVLIKLTHVYGGITVSILFIAAVITGTYKDNFLGSYTGRSLAFVSFFLPALLVLSKPIVQVICQTSVLLRPVQLEDT